MIYPLSGVPAGPIEAKVQETGACDETLGPELSLSRSRRRKSSSFIFFQFGFNQELGFGSGIFMTTPFIQCTTDRLHDMCLGHIKRNIGLQSTSNKQF